MKVKEAMTHFAERGGISSCKEKRGEMKRSVIASIIVSVLFLSACSLPGTNRTGGTQITQTTAPATTSAVTAVPNSAKPAGGDVITNTTDITVTTDLTPTTGITTTTDITPSAEITPSTATTITAQTGDMTVNQTDIKSLVTRVRLNVRSGPGTTYKIIAHLTARHTIKVNGISTDSQWYRVLCLDGSEGDCWVSASPAYVTAKK